MAGGWQGCVMHEALSRGGRTHHGDLEKLAVKVLENLENRLSLPFAESPLTRVLECLSKRSEEKLKKEALRPVERAA